MQIADDLLRHWADIRETSHEIAKAIFARAVSAEDAHRIWWMDAGSPERDDVLRDAWSRCENGVQAMKWAGESVTRQEGTNV